jgi:hypothetical protein
VRPGRSRERPGSTEREVALGLGALRIAVGVGALAATSPALRLVALEESDAGSRALARLAGSRDVALGALAVAAARDRRLLRAVALVNACVDAADAATFAMPLARREGLDRAALLGVPSAVAASAAGFWLARRLG